jgi:hypothetical protein
MSWHQNKHFLNKRIGKQVSTSTRQFVFVELEKVQVVHS